ncbi:MAG: NFACT family protein [Planctomycetes bacterium]|nr:NFACT family protein [Planctomycetota bacterium]
MILTAENIGELVREIAPLIVGLTCREVTARPPRDVLLSFAKADDKTGPPAWRVLVAADGDAPRVHVQRGRFERHDGPLGPFFRRLANELQGLTLRACTQVAGDRIVCFEFRGDEPRTLIAELVGRHSNLVLLGPGERVLDMLVPPPEDKPDPRLVVGKSYAPPPGRAVKSASPAALLATKFAAHDAEIALRKHEADNAAPLSWLVENALGAQADEARAARERRELVERLERRHKNARSLVFGMEARLKAAAEAERVQQDGELLKAHLHEVKRGAKAIEVTDFFDPEGGSRSVKLDPKLSPQENLERIFTHAKKLERSGAIVAEEIEIAREKLARLEAHLDAARLDDADIAALFESALQKGLLDEKPRTGPKKRAVQAPRVPYKTFHAVHGSEIRVGRTARDNDDLTFRHANGNDIWLHTADTPGSHVILRLARAGEPDSEEVLDAAHLAAHFSPIAGARTARVHMARRKEVHKPRGAKPGLVTLSGGKILDVRMQPERLKRLLGTHRAPPQEG